MFRRVLMFVSLIYLFIAFGFIFLVMANASALDDAVFVAESDARVIIVMCFLGLLATMALGLRMLVDSRYRRDLERQVTTPRRKSDVANRESA